MTELFKICVNSGKFCCKDYKFLNQSYNLLKVFPTNNFNQSLINKCKSFKAKIITHSESFQLDIYKIKFRCNEMRLFYDGNRYNSFFNKKFCSAELILSDMHEHHNDIDIHCNNHQSLDNKCSQCDDLENLFKSDNQSHNSNKNNSSNCDCGKK